MQAIRPIASSRVERVQGAGPETPRQPPDPIEPDPSPQPDPRDPPPYPRYEDVPPTRPIDGLSATARRDLSPQLEASA